MNSLELPVDRLLVWNRLKEFSRGRRGSSWTETLRLATGKSPYAMGEISLSEQLTASDLQGVPVGVHLRIIVCQREEKYQLRWNNPKIPDRTFPSVYHADLLPDRETFHAVRSGWMKLADPQHLEVWS